MPRGILSEVHQLLGQEPDENANGRVRLYRLILSERNSCIMKMYAKVNTVIII